jgi:hypothetical protein
MNDHYLLFSPSLFLCRKKWPEERKGEKKERKTCQKTTKKMYRILLIPF